MVLSQTEKPFSLCLFRSFNCDCLSISAIIGAAIAFCAKVAISPFFRVRFAPYVRLGAVINPKVDKNDV